MHWAKYLGAGSAPFSFAFSLHLIIHFMIKNFTLVELYTLCSLPVAKINPPPPSLIGKLCAG